MHEADAHPMHHQVRRAAADFGEPLGVGGDVRVVMGHHPVGELAQQRVFLVRGKDFEVAETNEAGRDPAHDGTRLVLRVTVVEHVAHHLIACADQAQRARGRHAQMEHGFAAQELAYRRAQHGAAVGAAGVGRRAGALELQLLPLPGRVDHFAQRDGAAVAQLSRPVAELVTAVARRIRLHAGQQPVAGECFDRGVDAGRALEAELRTEHVRPGEQFGRSHRRRRREGVGHVAHLARAHHLRRVRRQAAHEQVVEGDFIKPSGGNGHGKRRTFGRLHCERSDWPAVQSAASFSA